MPRINSREYNYIQELFSQEDALLQEITASHAEGTLPMQLSPVEGKLLYMLLKIAGAKTAVEIGTLAGYSATWIARALGEGGKLYCFERDERMVEGYKARIAGSELADRVEFYVGDARQKLGGFTHMVDAVFIDADKGAYPMYFEHARRILKPGGLLIADNVFLYGNVYDEPRKAASSNACTAMKEFNLAVAESEEFESVILPTLEGLLVARKRDI